MLHGIRICIMFFGIMLVTNFAYAKTVEIEMLNKDSTGRKMVYSHELMYIDLGDTVTWVPKSKGHNVEIIAAPEGFDIPKKS